MVRSTNYHSLSPFHFYFEMVLAGLASHRILLPQTPKKLGLQACAASLSSIYLVSAGNQTHGLIYARQMLYH